MRTTRTLAIAAALGLGLASVASANVVYDSETTNDWFKANVATSSELTSPPWTKPSKGGDAVVKGASNAHYIALDTDLDDPLTYAAAGSADVAVVAAEMTAIPGEDKMMFAKEAFFSWPRWPLSGMRRRHTGSVWSAMGTAERPG